MFQVNEKGIIQVDATDWQQMLTDEVYKPAFGELVDLDAATPIGALENADIMLGMKIQNALAECANAYNPFSATGANLTKIGASFGYIRRTQTPAVASVVFTGATGTAIPTGYSLLDGLGNEWTTDSATTVGTPVGATCAVAGTKAPAGTITTLNGAAIVGVDGVVQSVAGLDGVEEEKDEAMSSRMVTTGYAGRGRGTLGAIAAAISNVNGVYGLSFYENYTDASITWRGKTLVAHSIYFAVAGGSNDEIARAIAITKTNGCSTNGSTTISWTDPGNSSYVFNYLIDRPTFKYIHVKLLSKEGLDLSELLPTFVTAIAESQSLNAFPLGGSITSVDVLNRIPKELLDLGIVSCNLSEDGTEWKKSVDTNADEIVQIPDANISIAEWS